MTLAIAIAKVRLVTFAAQVVLISTVFQLVTQDTSHSVHYSQ